MHAYMQQRGGWSACLEQGCHVLNQSEKKFPSLGDNHESRGHMALQQDKWGYADGNISDFFHSSSLSIEGANIEFEGAGENFAKNCSAGAKTAEIQNKHVGTRQKIT